MGSRAGIRWSCAGLAALGLFLGAGIGSREAAEDEAGREVFVAKGCATCHEERAVLQAPHLSVLRKDRSFFGLATGMWNQAPMMWANLQDPGLRWPRLTPGEVADLARYLNNGAGLADPPPNPARGQLALREKGCLTCHTVDGLGRRVSKDLIRQVRFDSDEAWVAAMWNHAPSMLAVHASQRLAYPLFQGRELADLIGFLRLSPRPR